MSKTKVTIIAAISDNHAIGLKDGHKGMPWPNMKTDQKFFKSITMGTGNTGHPVCMGRNTFLGFDGNLLSGRHHLVLSSNSVADSPSVSWRPDVASILAHPKANETGQLFVLGGPQTWNAFIGVADELLVTYIGESYPADAFYPNLSIKKLSLDRSAWKLETCSFQVDEVNRTPLTFTKWLMRE